MVKKLYISSFSSPLGEICLAGTENTLHFCWFADQTAPKELEQYQCIAQEIPLLSQGKAWLGDYFAGSRAPLPFPIAMAGSAFQQTVWQLLAEIPYGQRVTYGQLAKQIAAQQGKAHMSPQAVGAAVGKNPAVLFLPCHRVVGTNGPGGFSAGLERKLWLLELESQ